MADGINPEVTQLEPIEPEGAEEDAPLPEEEELEAGS